MRKWLIKQQLSNFLESSRITGLEEQWGRWENHFNGDPGARRLQVKFKNSDDWKRAKTMKSRRLSELSRCGNRRDDRSGGENKRVGESFIHKGERQELIQWWIIYLLRLRFLLQGLILVLFVRLTYVQLVLRQENTCNCS